MRGQGTKWHLKLQTPTKPIQGENEGQNEQNTTYKLLDKIREVRKQKELFNRKTNNGSNNQNDSEAFRRLWEKARLAERNSKYEWPVWQKITVH